MGVAFHIAAAGDAPALNTALRQLSRDLGDAHGATDADIARAITGPHPAARGILGRDREDVIAAALYSSTFSTVRGPGVHVSDLWVAPDRRGTGLGKRLLAAILRDAGAIWGAQRLTLAVYHDSAAARRFYDRLGFAAARHYTTMVLEKEGADALKGTT